MCPKCNATNTRVVDSRVVDKGVTTRRRRECSSCSFRFTTMETSVLSVVKRNGVTEDFSRDKVLKGVYRACQGRNVSRDALEHLAHTVEQRIRQEYGSQVRAHDIGLAILAPLQDLDEVAYLRFASVYKSFESAEDFEREIEHLRATSALREAQTADTAGDIWSRED